MAQAPATRAQRVDPAGPKVSRTPPRPQEGRERCIKARPFRQSGISWFDLDIRRSVRAAAPNDGGLLFGRRLHVREYALGALLCERAAAWRALATAMHDGERRSRYRGWRERGGPCRSEPRASEWIAGAGQADVSGAGGCRLFRFRSAARHLWADRAPALTAVGGAAAAAAAEASVPAAAATPIA